MKAVYRKLRSAGASIAGIMFWLLTGVGLVFAYPTAMIIIGTILPALWGEPLILESIVLAAGALCCALAALWTLSRLLHKRWNWLVQLILTSLAVICGILTLHSADEVIEVSMGQMLFYPALLLPFHALRSALSKAS